MKLILSAALAALFLVSNNAQAELTGCLNSGGQIKSVAIGPDPAKPCNTPKETEVTFGSGGGSGVGPKGDTGDKGDMGDKGDKGDMGGMGIQGLQGIQGIEGPAGSGGGGAQKSLMLTHHKPFGVLTDGQIFRDEWAECATILGGRPANTNDLMTLPVDPSISGGLIGWINPYIVSSHVTPLGAVELVDITGNIFSSATDVGLFTCRNQAVAPTWGQAIGTWEGLAANGGLANPTSCQFSLNIICAVPIP